MENLITANGNCHGLLSRVLISTRQAAPPDRRCLGRLLCQARCRVSQTSSRSVCPQPLRRVSRFSVTVEGLRVKDCAKFL